MNTDSAFRVIETAIATKTTDELMTMHGLLDEQATLTEDERMIKAAISEVVTERHNLLAEIDAILDADETFEVTYGQAMARALAKVAA